MYNKDSLPYKEKFAMKGECLNEQTNWRLILENPSNLCEVEKAYTGRMTEMTLIANSSQAAHT